MLRGQLNGTELKDGNQGSCQTNCCLSMSPLPPS
jgi:hypothetical protein